MADTTDPVPFEAENLNLRPGEFEAGMNSKPVRCLYCRQASADWKDGDLVRGKRPVFGGIEYHCMNAFYGAS